MQSGSGQVTTILAWRTDMKLEDLIAPIINNPGVLPATLGVVLPQTIELPPELHGYFGRT
jgi:hypothetical protein